MFSRNNAFIAGFLLFGLPVAYAQLAPKPSYGFATVAQPANLFSRYSAVADINRDGKPDLITADNSGLLVTFGNGDGTYQPPVRTLLTDSANAFTVADIDGDGRYDVVVYSMADATLHESLSVLLGSADGTFRFVAKIPIFGALGNRTLAGANPIGSSNNSTS